MYVCCSSGLCFSAVSVVFPGMWLATDKFPDVDISSGNDHMIDVNKQGDPKKWKITNRCFGGRRWVSQ